MLTGLHSKSTTRHLYRQRQHQEARRRFFAQASTFDSLVCFWLRVRGIALRDTAALPDNSDVAIAAALKSAPPPA